MAKGNYYTPLGNGLWRDERTGAVGTLKVGRGGGFYVDANDQSGTSREKFKKEQISQAYRDADDKVANFYRRKNKEGQLKSSSKEEDVREAKKEANDRLAETVEFGNLYNNPLQALPGEYDINEFTKVDENAKTRMDRFAERNQIAENLQKYAEDEFGSKNLFILDRNVIEDENGNTYVLNNGDDETYPYGRQLNAQDMEGMGKRYFSDEEKVAGYRRRKGFTQEVDDREIESDIKSLFTYQNEKNMGAGPEKDPMKKYYDKYGKENVDRVWADMDNKYAVIQGVAMDTEGLRYNELVEKDKYSPEAIDYYRKQVENAWQNNSWDSRKYNEATRKAKEEFERFDSERSSLKENRVKDIENKLQDIEWQGERGARNDGHLSYNENYGTLTKEYKELTGKDYEAPFKQGVYKEKTEIPTLDEEVRNLVKENYGEGVDLNDLYDEELDAITKVAQDNIKEMKGTQKASTTPTEKWTDTDKYEYDLYKRAKENPDSIDPMTENSTDWDALDKKWSNRYDYDKEQEEFGAEAQVERFKERKGKDLGINITEAPSRASKTPKPTETYTKSGKINYKAFGITRTPESDFSDDGTRFASYMLDNGMEMTVARGGDETFMSVRSPYDKEISYKEYSSLPHYKDLDMYNGVSGEVDLNKLVSSANAYMNEYNELKKSKGLPIDNRSVLMRRTDNFVDAIDNANASYKYHSDYYKNHPGEYSNWRYHNNEARKAKNRAEKLQQKMDNFISESTKEKPVAREYNNYKKAKFSSSKIDNIKAQVERYKKRKNK